MQKKNIEKQIISTTCPYCGVGCGMEVSSKLYQADTASIEFKSKVKGDSEHPANFGKLCVKGSAAGETIDFDGRMLSPQINGKKVDWDTALNKVASEFQKIIREHGPDAVAFYVSGQLLTEDYYVANKLLKGFVGTANIDTNSRLCMASAVVGYKRAFGADTVPCSYEDLELADLIVIIGSNTAWAHPIVYQRIAAAKKARPNMKVVVVDPRQTATCDIADLHLPLKPGTDAVLFNGLLAYLAQSPACNNDYINHYTEGFDSAISKAQERQGSIADVAAQCELSEVDLQQFFAWYESNPKTVSLYSQGVNQSSSGVDKSNAIINCHLATGRIGKEGMGPFSITGQPNAMGGREVGGLANQLAAHMDFNKPENIDVVSRFWQASNMAQQNGLKAVDMFQAVAEKKIKAIWVMNTNPVVSMPDADAVKKALANCEMVVVSDCMQHTDTTAVANVLLPALTWGETDGTVTNSDRTISRQRRFMQGPKQARADWWIICQVAQKMGFTKAFAFPSPADIFREHAALSGYENRGHRDFDISLLKDISEAEYTNLKPFQWPLNAENAKGTKRMFADGKFFTDSGKAQFISIEPRLPKHATTKDLPFVFNTGRVRDQWHTMTRTAKTAKLMAHTDEPYVAINPKDAMKIGLREAQLAKVSNALGQYVGRTVFDMGQRQGSVFAPMHWTAQYASHGRVDVLVNPVVDPLSGQPESKHSPVKVEAYNTQWHGFILSREEIPQHLISSIADYWVMVKGKQFYRYEIAGKNTIQNSKEWSKPLIKAKSFTRDDMSSSNNQKDQEMLSYEDVGAKQFRFAILKNHQLQLVTFISPNSKLPPRTWLGNMFSEKQLDSRNRLHLLAGQASGTKDPGKMICSCFGVGLNTIVEAIQTKKLTSAKAIGDALKAGTNCGSCVPELTEILCKELKSS